MIESSWNHGKTIANQILAYRRDRSLPPIPCVMLENVVGQYWRFHHEGTSAVSTIEAIAHTAAASGAISDEQAEDLLSIFYAQKYRVLDRSKKENEPPMAIVVEGFGVGSWLHVTPIPDR